MSGLAIVTAKAELVTPDALITYTVQITNALPGVEDAHQIKAEIDKLSVIRDYIGRRSTEGALQAETCLRRMEMRIAELTPKSPGSRNDLGTSPGTRRGAEPALPKGQMTEAYKEFENPDVVDHVITESTQEDPPTKAKVIRAIDTHIAETKAAQEPPAPPVKKLGKRAAAKRARENKQITAWLWSHCSPPSDMWNDWPWHALEASDQDYERWSDSLGQQITDLKQLRRRIAVQRTETTKESNT